MSSDVLDIEFLMMVIARSLFQVKNDMTEGVAINFSRHFSEEVARHNLAAISEQARLEAIKSVLHEVRMIKKSCLQMLTHP